MCTRFAAERVVQWGVTRSTMHVISLLLVPNLLCNFVYSDFISCFVCKKSSKCVSPVQTAPQVLIIALHHNCIPCRCALRSTSPFSPHVCDILTYRTISVQFVPTSSYLVVCLVGWSHSILGAHELGVEGERARAVRT